jgi:RNA polymerase sigma-70 factor (ECF subfamily)
LKPEADFADLVRPCLPRLYGMARRLVGDEAEDLVQETLISAYRGVGQLQDRQAIQSWLAAILVNHCRDRWRVAKRRVDEVSLDDVDDFSLYRHLVEEDPFPYSDSLHLDFMRLFGRDDVHAVLVAMPEIYRAPLVLHYIEGFATKEIARLLGVPLGTVLARLHRGRKVFERGLWEYAQREGLLTTEAAR